MVIEPDQRPIWTHVQDAVLGKAQPVALPGGENRATTIYAGIFLWQNCGDVFNRDLGMTLDNERTQEALRFYAELLQSTPPDAGARGSDTLPPQTGPLPACMARQTQLLAFVLNGTELRPLLAG